MWWHAGTYGRFQQSDFGRKRIRRLLLVASALALLAAMRVAPASASAFFIREQSAVALGTAFAGASAGGDDASSMFYNAAALTRLKGSSVTVAGSVIDARGKFRDGEGKTFLGTPLGGGDGGRNAGRPSFVPAAYGVWDLQSLLEGENVKLGLAVNSPFGLETEYTDGWIGRYYALHSRLRSIDINPAVAWEVWHGISISAGLQVQYVEALLTNSIDYGSFGAVAGVPGAIPGGQDGFAKVSGDDWGVGYTLGLLLQPWQATRIGVGYRSAVRHEVHGDARIRGDSAGIAQQIGAFTGNDGARAKMTTPEVVSIGVRQQLTDAWAVSTEATWTRWNRMRVLRITFDNPALPPSVTEQDWHDTWFLACGVSWRPSQNWVLRTGFAYDQSPVPNSTRTPRTPANSGYLLAGGLTWQPLKRLSLSIGYGHFFIENPRMNLKTTSDGNATRGSLQGSSDNAIDSVSAQLSWTF